MWNYQSVGQRAHDNRCETVYIGTCNIRNNNCWYGWYAIQKIYDCCSCWQIVLLDGRLGIQEVINKHLHHCRVNHAMAHNQSWSSLKKTIFFIFTKKEREKNTNLSSVNSNINETYTLFSEIITKDEWHSLWEEDIIVIPFLDFAVDPWEPFTTH